MISVGSGWIGHLLVYCRTVGIEDSSTGWTYSVQTPATFRGHFSVILPRYLAISDPYLGGGKPDDISWGYAGNLTKDSPYSPIWLMILTIL